MNLSLFRACNAPRNLAWGGLLAACVVSAACSSTSTPPADAFLAATVGGGGVACPFQVDPSWLPVGSPTGGQPTPVTDQGSTGNGTATINCTVHPSGNGFDIALEVSVDGAQGGQVTITSPSGAGAVTTMGAAGGITASFFDAVNQGPFTDTNCAVTYTYGSGPVPISPPIAAGRIWGHITCMHAVATGGETKTGPDGGATAAACPATADFLFEQCYE